jgi:hypothetical protein
MSQRPSAPSPSAATLRLSEKGRYNCHRLRDYTHHILIRLRKSYRRPQV